ncbi:MAG TPA: hypothetical protein DCY07_02140 [Rhodospirillaceae bacterium]|nr:hypothetical protein [Rhodospirillaceae bacterium]
MITYFPAAKMVGGNFIDSSTATALTVRETIFPYQFRRNNHAFRGHKSPIMFSFKKDMTVHQVPALAVTIETLNGPRREIIPFVSEAAFEALQLETDRETGVDLTNFQRKARADFVRINYPETVSTFVPHRFKAPHAFSPTPR